MKKFNLSLVAVLAMSTMAMAGGDIAPVEPIVETPMVEVSQGAFYLGAAYSILDVDLTDGIDTAELEYDAFMLQAGYKFNPYIAVEGRYWGAIGDGDLTINNITLNNGVGDIDATAWGIYVKPMYPVTEVFDVYALLGYANTDADFDNDSWDDGGFSWGLGASYAFTESFAGFVDYVELYNDDSTIDGFPLDVEVSTWNFGVTYTF